MPGSFRFPTDDLDDRSKLLSLLGSFWAGVFTQNELAAGLVFSRAQLERQAVGDLEEAAACLARHDVPVWHTPRWRRLVLRESERNNVEALLAKYGEARLYGDYQLRYGVIPPTESGLSSFPVESAVKGAPVVCNRLTSPSVTLLAGLDFSLDPVLSLISFRENPFDNADIPKRDVYAGSEIVDRELVLWLFRPQLDRDLVWTHVGYPWRIDLPAGQGYKDLLNALWDAAVRGTADFDVRRIFSTVFDVPLVRNEEETVEVIDTGDPAALVIVTDQEVYRFSQTASPSVSVGDTVRQGDVLTDTLAFFEFNRGQVPSAGQLPALTLGREFLGTAYADGLTFENRRQDTEIDTSGVFTELRFPLGGWPNDVEQFWEAMQARGIATGQTLANLLDTRESPAGEPAAGDLPAAVNPLEFLAANVLRTNTLVVKVKLATIGENSLPLTGLRALRRVLPPHTVVILVVELGGDAIATTMNEEDAATGCSQAGDLAAGAGPGEISSDAEDAVQAGTLGHLKGICL